MTEQELAALSNDLFEGKYTLNEARKLLGLEPTPGGDIYLTTENEPLVKNVREAWQHEAPATYSPNMDEAYKGWGTKSSFKNLDFNSELTLREVHKGIGFQVDHPAYKGNWDPLLTAGTLLVLTQEHLDSAAEWLLGNSNIQLVPDEKISIPFGVKK